MRKAILLVMLVAAPLAADTKVYRVKHRPAESLARTLNGAGMRVDASRDFNTITLTGTAEQIKVAEGILEQFDTPRRQAEFVLRVVEASSSAQGPNDAADLVPSELKSLLRYTRFAQRDSAILRGMEAEQLQIALGGNLNGYLRFTMRDAAMELWVRVNGPPITIKNKGEDSTHFPTLVETTTPVKSGETVVLGASKMQGGSSALIVLLTAKLLP